MTARSWRWLRIRIIGLLEQPASVVAYQVGDVMKLAQIPATRIGLALNPPVFD